MSTGGIGEVFDLLGLSSAGIIGKVEADEVFSSEACHEEPRGIRGLINRIAVVGDDVSYSAGRSINFKTPGVRSSTPLVSPRLHANFFRAPLRDQAQIGDETGHHGS